MAQSDAPIILVSGPPGAGKSSVCRHLVDAAKAPIAYIEGDTFWSFIAKGKPDRDVLDGRREAGRIITQAMVASAARFARGGYPTLLDFSIVPAAVEFIRAKLKGIPLELIVICPSEEVCARRAASRTVGSMPDYSIYKDFYATFQNLGPLERHAFRSDDATAEELAEEIREGLDAGAFRYGK